MELTGDEDDTNSKEKEKKAFAKWQQRNEK